MSGVTMNSTVYNPIYPVMDNLKSGYSSRQGKKMMIHKGRHIERPSIMTEIGGKITNSKTPRAS